MFDFEYHLKNLPSKPGVYLMKNSLGEVIYVGKAKILKKRISYKNDTYLYNIKFIGLNNRHINQIHKYVADNLPESKKDK